MKTRLCLLFFCVVSVCISVSSQVRIIGHAPQFVNQRFFLWRYDDFISGKKTLVQDTSVNAQGIFKFQVNVDQIKKFVIGNDQLTAYLYVQPNAKYNVEFIADQAQHASYNLKEEVELTFYDLDSNDINYKILGFEAWIDNYMADIFVERDVNPGSYASKIALLKMMVAHDIKKDTSAYFANFMRYTVANDIDNQRFIGSPTKIDQYKQQLAGQPILYGCDYYMDYFKSFYDQFIYQIEPEIANQLFAAYASNNLISSDTILAQASFVENKELRSLVQLYLLKQGLNDNFLPRSVIISTLKKIGKKSPYQIHREIAINILSQLTLIHQGDPFPFNELIGSTGQIDFTSLQGKYIYIHAFNPANTLAIGELPALKKLKNAYGSKVEFVTLYVDGITDNASETRAMEQITWKKIGLPLDSHVWNNLGILTFPYYILLDRDSNVMATPALGPSPNGKYETIEKTFYDLSKP